METTGINFSFDQIDRKRGTRWDGVMSGKEDIF